MRESHQIWAALDLAGAISTSYREKMAIDYRDHAHERRKANKSVDPTPYMSQRFPEALLRSTQPRGSKEAARPHPGVAHH